LSSAGFGRSDAVFTRTCFRDVHTLYVGDLDAESDPQEYFVNENHSSDRVTALAAEDERRAVLHRLARLDRSLTQHLVGHVPRTS
jgi:hypothetical protein